MSFKLSSYARDFYGDKDYTIEQGILEGKGELVKKRNWETQFNNEYYYREGILVMRVDGVQAKGFARRNNIKIKEY